MGSEQALPLKVPSAAADNYSMRTQAWRRFVALGVLVLTVLGGGIAAAITRNSASVQAASRTEVLSTADGRAPSPLSGLPVSAAPLSEVPLPPPPTIGEPPTTPAPSSTTTTAAAVSRATVPPTTATTTTTTTVPQPVNTVALFTPRTTLPPPTGPATATFSLSPTSGPKTTLIKVSGNGCLSGGTPTGAGLYVYNPSGTAISGDGGAAMPDGTWTIPIYINEAPGQYTVRAQCLVVNGPALFEYPVAATFTVTG